MLPKSILQTGSSAMYHHSTTTLVHHSPSQFRSSGSASACSTQSMSPLLSLSARLIVPLPVSTWLPQVAWIVLAIGESRSRVLLCAWQETLRFPGESVCENWREVSHDSKAYWSDVAVLPLIVADIDVLL